MTTGTEYVLLIRKPNQWVRYGSARSSEEAEKLWREKIKGRGITAWTVWCSPAAAQVMLDNPDITDPEEAEKIVSAGRAAGRGEGAG